MEISHPSVALRAFLLIAHQARHAIATFLEFFEVEYVAIGERVGNGIFFHLPMLMLVSSS